VSYCQDIAIYKNQENKNKRKHLKFRDSNKSKTLGSRMGYFKNTQAFPQLRKICSVSGFALLLKEEPCPLKPSKGFLNNPSWTINLFFIPKF